MKVVIIGGGPAGMLAAISASKPNNIFSEKDTEPSQVILLEKNEKLGKKLFISGKGRCNLTNNCDRDEFFKNIVTNPKFFYSAYSEFSNVDLKKLIEDNGCPLKVERGNRVFPISDKSYDVIDALKKVLKNSGVKVKLNTKVKSIKISKTVKCCDKHSETNARCRDAHCESEEFIVTTNNNEKITADKVIIATGGLSYPSTGSTGDGYEFAKKFDINVINQSPSLVPFNIKELDECKKMQGLTLKNIAIKIYDGDNIKKTLYDDFGELLFTHFGVSGPVILSGSCYIKAAKNNILSIDLKPALSEEQLDARLIREIDENRNKKLKSLIESLLPSSMVEVFLDRLSLIIKKEKYDSIKISEVKNSEIDKELRKTILGLLKDFKYTIISKRDFDEAIVTSGGIDVKELNPKTMECKKVKGLYFAGEVIDIDAMTGGFNIQIACTTGFVAGKSVNDF